MSVVLLAGERPRFTVPYDLDLLAVRVRYLPPGTQTWLGRTLAVDLSDFPVDLPAGTVGDLVLTVDGGNEYAWPQTGMFEVLGPLADTA